MFPNASHALLQEADINLAQLMKQQGFYVTKRSMSAPVKKRTKSTFGSANPIEKPTMGELDYYTEGYSCNSLIQCSFVLVQVQQCSCLAASNACLYKGDLNQQVGVLCYDMLPVNLHVK